MEAEDVAVSTVTFGELMAEVVEEEVHLGGIGKGEVAKVNAFCGPIKKLPFGVNEAKAYAAMKVYLALPGGYRLFGGMSELELMEAATADYHKLRLVARPTEALDRILPVASIEDWSPKGFLPSETKKARGRRDG